MPPQVLPPLGPTQAGPSSVPDYVTVSQQEPRPRKRKRYYDSDTDEEEDDDSFDYESYYKTGDDDSTPEATKTLISKAFRNCLSNEKWRELSNKFPRPKLPATRMPTADQLLADFMEKEFPKKSDE